MTDRWTSEVNAFGTRNDWSTWTGVEIGTRIIHFLKSKIDPAYGDVNMPLSASSSKLGSYFKKNNNYSRSKLCEHSERSSILSSKSEEYEMKRRLSSRSVGNDSLAALDMMEFFSYCEPPITLSDYIKRLINYTRISISPVNLAVALFYIERIENKGCCEVNKYSIFRLFAVAYLIAYKYMDDPPVMKNFEFCKIAGIPLAELNRLELSFLKAINFELGVGSDIAVCQKITRILVPPKVSPAIIIGKTIIF